MSESEDDPSIEAKRQAALDMYRRLLTEAEQRASHQRFVQVCVRFAAVVFTLASIVAAIQWHRGAGQRQVLREQPTWMNYHAPPEQVNFSRGDAKSGSNAAQTDSRALDAFLKLAGKQQNLAGLCGDGPVLFCGGRSCAAGERLVVISLSANHHDEDAAANHSQVMSFCVNVFVPADKGKPLTMAGIDAQNIGSFHGSANDVIHIHAGQPDYVDRSHFSILYDINGDTGIVDGKLQADGARVVFNLRTGGPLVSVPAKRSDFDGDRD